MTKRVGLARPAYKMRVDFHGLSRLRAGSHNFAVVMWWMRWWSSRWRTVAKIVVFVVEDARRDNGVGSGGRSQSRVVEGDRKSRAVERNHRSRVRWRAIFDLARDG